MLIGVLAGFNLKCNYAPGPWGLMNAMTCESYRNLGHRLKITSRNDFLTHIDGTRIGASYTTDIPIIDIHTQVANFIPYGLGKRFPN